MRRKRSTPWIHRWSRPLMAGIASIGAAVTAYLTYSKLSGNEAACPTGGCDIVLSSPYATVFGQPLALFGFLAYVSMIIFAIAPLLVRSPEQRELREKLDAWTGLLLFMGATAMMIFSGYLMYLLTAEIKAICVYCIGSALLSTSLFVLAIIGRDWQDRGQLVFTGIIVALVVLVGTLGVYANINNPSRAEQSATETAGTPITTTSGEAELALAAHLQQIGAKMYGAFWCAHCHDQKQLFGQEAFSKINYVECSPEGRGTPPAQVCIDRGIQGYPTWEVNGQLLESGSKSLEALATASGYSGPRNFINVLPGS
ncbi:MAG: vitamin K epoxide reductase family protein (plasmid) [Phormidium sp.]